MTIPTFNQQPAKKEFKQAIKQAPLGKTSQTPTSYSPECLVPIQRTLFTALTHPYYGSQEYEAKISSGKIYELAEVVRDLNKGDDLMIEQSYSERQLFEKAYDRILSEFQIVLNSSREDTQKKLDKALKRNLNKEVKEENKTNKTPNNNPLPVEEPISDVEEQIEE